MAERQEKVLSFLPPRLLWDVFYFTQQKLFLCLQACWGSSSREHVAIISRWRDSSSTSPSTRPQSDDLILCAQTKPISATTSSASITQTNLRAANKRRKTAVWSLKRLMVSNFQKDWFVRRCQRLPGLQTCSGLLGVDLSHVITALREKYCIKAADLSGASKLVKHTALLVPAQRFYCWTLPE